MLIKLRSERGNLWLNPTTVTNVRPDRWAQATCVVDLPRRRSPTLVHEPADSLRRRLEALTSKDPNR